MYGLTSILCWNKDEIELELPIHFRSDEKFLFQFYNKKFTRLRFQSVQLKRISGTIFGLHYKMQQ